MMIAFAMNPVMKGTRYNTKGNIEENIDISFVPSRLGLCNDLIIIRKIMCVS